MNRKGEVRDLYKHLSPKDKARLALRCQVDGEAPPYNLLWGMSLTERTQYDLAGWTLSTAHWDASVLLQKIMAEALEATLRMTILGQTRWELIFLDQLESLLYWAKEPYTTSEYARLTEEAQQDLIPLDELLETAVFDQLENEGECAAKAATDKKYRARRNKKHRATWEKMEKESMEMLDSGRLEGETVDGKVSVRWGSWCELKGKELIPTETRVFPDEMADMVEEMRRERTSLRKAITGAFRAVTENGDSEVMFSPLEFAGLRVCPHHPDDSRREIHHTFVQETFPNQIQAWRRRMANLEGVFKRLGDEEFGSSEVMEWPVAERLAAVKGLVSGLARDFGVEDAPVAANDEVVEAWLRTLTGRAKAGA